MKYILCMVLAVLLMGCWDNKPEMETHDKGYIHIDDRRSLATVFSEDHEAVNEMLTDDYFYVYAKSLEYAFANVADNSAVEWLGPKKMLKGRVTVIALGKNTIDGCREFTQEVKLGTQKYSGSGHGCFVNDHWVIKLK